MRVARYFPMVVVSSLVCQTVAPFPVRAADSVAVDVTDQEPAEQPLPQMQQMQMQNRRVDSAVQQANFYDSRPTANSTMIAPGGEQRKRGLITSEGINLPWFGRHSQSPPSQMPGPSQQTARNRVLQNQSIPTNTAQTRPRVAVQSASQAPAPSRPTQQRTVNGHAAQPLTLSNQNFRNPAAQPPMPIHQESTPRSIPLTNRPIAPAKPAPNSSPVSPWKGATPPAAAAAAAAGSAAGTVTGAMTAKPAGPASAADQLIAQAHTMSTSAKSEEDFSRIIETCRRAQASHASGEAAKYANNLTAWSLNRRGQLKAESGHEKEAILDFDDAIRTDATCWRAVHNRGVLLAQAGQFEKAFDDFSHTIQLNPQFAKAYSNRAALFMVANNLNAAHQDYKKAIDLDANLAVAHRGCGRVCQLMNRLDDAVLHYDAAVQLAPNDAYAAACRADLLTDLGRYSDASAEYNRALQLDPKSSQANCGSAWLLATCPDSALRNPALAIERANQAVELSAQKDAVCFDSLAAAQACSGNFDDAMKSIHRAIELAPIDERDAYKERLVVYQQAKPYRIAPIDRMAQQASYQTK